MDTNGLVNPRCSSTAVGDSAPQVVGSISPTDESAPPVHQGQLVAEDTTQNTVEIRTQVQQLLLMTERIEKALRSRRNGRWFSSSLGRECAACQAGDGASASSTGSRLLETSENPHAQNHGGRTCP